MYDLMEQVKELRNRTGISIMECKKALEESKGDIEKAIEILRKKGFERAEKISGRETYQGAIGSYIHMKGKIGVLVELGCETDFVSQNEEFQNLVKDIAMHIAAMNPKYISQDSIPENILNKEREIYRDQLISSGKPEAVIEKIIDGKMKKFYEEVCLLEQPFVKDEKMKVKQYLAHYINKFGENIVVRRFVRFQQGESIN
ncbi:MAG: translation elongation factor Ts [Acidobacteriota bacterium]